MNPNCQSPDDQPFQHYTMKHRVVSWVSRRLFGSVTYTARQELIKGMRRRGGLAWLPELITGSTETPEKLLWRNQDLRNLVIYDVGAFYGLLTLLFARQGRQVISYEPNTRNHTRLIENLRLNGLSNVIVRKVGLGAGPGAATMVASPLMPGGASIERQTVAGLLNASRRVFSEEISITTLDDDIREMSLPAPDFVKIDVEGAELAALRGARNTLRAHRPRLFLEVHGETMSQKRKNVADIVACLRDLGYSDIRHVETGAAITGDNAALAARGHLYCRWEGS